MQGRPRTTRSAAAKAPCKGAAGCDQSQPVREADDARKGRQMLAAARRGDACGQNWHQQGLSPVANRGSTRPRPVLNGATPMEVPPS
ncbi:hypothetical protein BHE74_00057156 [Ensete ventricosum]|nr:hypothetical protein BHE74_00057156 [Ensete ventricosum]